MMKKVSLTLRTCFAFAILACVLAAQNRENVEAAEKLYLQGLSEKNEKGCGYASEFFTKAIQLNPGDARLYKERASCAEFFSFDLALADYATAIYLKPDFADAFLSRAEFYFFRSDADRNTGDFTDAERSYFTKKALSDLEKAVAIDPKNPDIHSLRGKIYFHNLNDRENAFKDFDKAVSLAPRRTEYLISRAAHYRMSRQAEKAFADYSAVLTLDPKEYEAFYSRGLIHLEKGDFQNAVDDLTEAIKLKPDYSHFYERRAEAYRAMNKIPQAEADEKKAAELYRQLDGENP